MNYIGIDIGSTCAKTVVLNEKKELILEFVHNRLLHSRKSHQKD